MAKMYKISNKANEELNIKTKIIGGVEYMLSLLIGGNELWIATAGMQVNNPKCSKCGYTGVALDKHHVKGRKNSDQTIILCANCHREFHAENGYKL